MEMIPVIMNTNFERLGAIDDYSSFIWTTRYYTCGDFEICVEINSKSMELIKKDYYVTRDDDEHVGIIENIKIERNADAQEIVIASGRFLSSILSRRVIAQQTVISGTVSAGIHSLIKSEVISPAISARQIPNFTLGDFTTTETIEAQYTGSNLLETITAICQPVGLGFKTLLSDDQKFEFQLFQGVDRSYDQSENPYVVFSHEYDNLKSSEYEENYAGIATDVLVGGEGEGTSRYMQWASKESLSGLERYETFKDYNESSTNGEIITVQTYLSQLEQAGLEDLTTFTSAFTGTVYFDNYVYREDVNIGDICSIENERWGLHINSRLVEVIESVSESGEYSIVPTFGM